MSIPPELSIRIGRDTDGSLFIQRLRPDAPISEFYGERLTPLQMLLVAAAILRETPSFDIGGAFEEENDGAKPQQEYECIVGEDQPGFVYLMSDGEMYKIGRSGRPEERAKQLSAGMSRPVDLLHFFRCDDAIFAEQSLHERFRSNRVHGEWFFLGGDDVADLRSITEFANGEFLRGGPGQ